jgi:hypothetical protein
MVRLLYYLPLYVEDWSGGLDGMQLVAFAQWLVSSWFVRQGECSRLLPAVFMHVN